jgi:hypothetical protein
MDQPHTGRPHTGQLSLGIVATSHKENEYRLPIHPLHLDRIDAGLRRRVRLEEGYGERFGVPRRYIPASG